MAAGVAVGVAAVSRGTEAPERSRAARSAGAAGTAGEAGAGPWAGAAVVEAEGAGAVVAGWWEMVGPAGLAAMPARSPAAMEAAVALEVMVGPAGLAATEAAVALVACCSEMVGPAAMPARSPAAMEATV